MLIFTENWFYTLHNGNLRHFTGGGGGGVGFGKLCVPSEKSWLRSCSVSKRMSEHDDSEHQQIKGGS